MWKCAEGVGEKGESTSQEINSAVKKRAVQLALRNTGPHIAVPLRRMREALFVCGLV